MFSMLLWSDGMEISAYKQAEIPYINAVRPCTTEQHFRCAETMRLDGGEMTGFSR